MSAKLRNQLNVISELVMARPRFSLGNFGGEGMAKVVGFVRNALAAALSCFCGCFSGERYHRLPEEKDFEPHNRKSLSPILICDDEFLEEREESGNLLPEDTDIRELGDEEYGNSHKKNPLPPMVVSDDESLGDQVEVHNHLREESDFRELKEEAKFLKACGVLPGTPAEIRKWSEKLDKSVENGSERSMKFMSWLYNESTEKSKSEKPSDQSPTPVKLSEEWVTGTSSLKDTNSSDSATTSSSNSIKSNEMQDTITTNGVCHSEALSDSPSGPLSLKSDSSSSDSATSVTQPDQIGYIPVKLSEEWITDFSAVKDSPSESSLKDTNSSVSTRTRSVNSTRSDEMQNTITTNDACHTETPSGPLSLGSDSTSSHSKTPVTQPDQRGSNQNSDKQNVVIPIDLCNSEIHSTTPSITPIAFAPNIKSNIKSVRFKCDPDESSSSSNDFSSKSERSESSGSSSVSKLSPYPTPLKITDDMQTPGTVFASYMKNMSAAKRIRSQYVYSDQNWNPSLWKEFVGRLTDTNQLTEPHNQFDEAIEMCTPMLDIEKKILSDGNGMKNEASLSYWLKLASAEQHGNSDEEHFSSISGENHHSETIPRDNLHWKRNGIPNTNNKYKEDRKVNWHETPFEERLQKAISGETSTRPRNTINETLPIEFNEADENALTGLKSLYESKYEE